MVPLRCATRAKYRSVGPDRGIGPVRTDTSSWRAWLLQWHCSKMVWYQIHSLGAAGVPGANPDVDAGGPSGDGLRRLIPWLHHVADLGCHGVLLTPIFVSSTHGYDTVDPYRIDQRLGDDSAFDDFVAACHDRGLK